MVLQSRSGWLSGLLLACLAACTLEETPQSAAAIARWRMTREARAEGEAVRKQLFLPDDDLPVVRAAHQPETPAAQLRVAAREEVPASPLYPEGAAPAGSKKAFAAAKEVMRVRLREAQAAPQGHEQSMRKKISTRLPAASELPPGWKVHVTKTPKLRVYYSSPLNVSQWEPPPGMIPPSGAALEELQRRSSRKRTQTPQKGPVRAAAQEENRDSRAQDQGWSDARGGGRAGGAGGKGAGGGSAGLMPEELGHMLQKDAGKGRAYFEGMCAAGLASEEHYRVMLRASNDWNEVKHYMRRMGSSGIEASDSTVAIIREKMQRVSEAVDAKTSPSRMRGEEGAGTAHGMGGGTVGEMQHQKSGFSDTLASPEGTGGERGEHTPQVGQIPRHSPKRRSMDTQEEPARSTGAAHMHMHADEQPLRPNTSAQTEMSPKLGVDGRLGHEVDGRSVDVLGGAIEVDVQESVGKFLECFGASDEVVMLLGGGGGGDKEKEDLHERLRIMREMVNRSRLSDKGVSAAGLKGLVMLYCELGMHRDAVKTLNELRKLRRGQGLADEATHIAVMQACAVHGDYACADKIFARMKRRGLTIGREAHLALLHAHAQAGDLKAAQQLMHDMAAAGFRPDAQSLELLMLALCESVCGWERVRSSGGEVYFQRVRGGVNETSWRLPKGEDRIFEISRYLGVLEEGEVEGGGASSAGYYALMKACLACGKLNQSISTFVRMSRAGLPPDQRTYDVATCALARAVQAEGPSSPSAFPLDRMLRSMQAQGHLPSYDTCLALMHAYGSSKHTENLQRAMSLLGTLCMRTRREVCARAYTAAVAALCAGGGYEAAESALRRMTTQGVGAGVTRKCFLLLLRAYADVGKGREAERMMRMMEAGGVACEEGVRLVIEAFTRLSI